MSQPSPPVFILPDWPAPACVKAVVTTRAGGVSKPPYDSFNLAAHVGDDPAAVAANREQLCRQLGLPGMPVWTSQVHGVAVLRRDGVTEPQVSLEYDATYSNQPQTVCAVLTADCLPVLFCDRAGREVAAAHAGWRGLVDGVLATTLQAFTAVPADILAWLGPAIGPQAFEVGEDVRARFLAQWQAYGAAQIDVCFAPLGHGQYLADIYALARLQLQALGVRQIDGGDACTASDTAQFYSFRREGDTGRMASLIWIAG